MEDLIADLRDIDINNILDNWEWYFESPMELVLVTALGDLFLRDEDDNILLFNPGSAEIIEIAGNHEEFKQEFAKGNNINSWFLPALIDSLRAKLGPLQKGQCYGFIILPFLNGQYEISNFKIYPLKEYLDNLSTIYYQVKDLPEGTAIGNTNIK